ncbi:MAG TPA: DUF6036 family nucleotidyltransferase [Steroidobacteraceae bacterium]|jgi:hypothetical protein
MRPKSARPEYTAAFSEIALRIAQPLGALPSRLLPVKMYVAGGAALHFYTGERTSKDIDAAFSHRIALPEDLEVSYRDADGAARLLYFDRQYNDTFALMHEDAREDSLPLTLKGVDSAVLDVRLLSPVDLAVSKISRFSSQDREDIAALARHGLIRSSAVRARAEEAVSGYVGNLDTLRTSIGLACRIIGDIERQKRDAGG